MLAITQSSIQALDFLDRALNRNFQESEADKDRASRFVALKIQSDENELNRLNSLVQMKSNQLITLNKDFAATIGTLDKISSEQNATGIKTDAAKLLQRKASSYADERAYQIDQLNQLDSEIQSRISDIGLWSEAGMGIAPEVFQKYKKADKRRGINEESILSPEEMQMAFKDVFSSDKYNKLDERQQGIVKSAISSASQGLGQDEFKRRYDEATLALNQFEAQSSRMKIIASTNAANLEASVQPLIDEYKQKQPAVSSALKLAGYEDDSFLYNPDILKNSTSTIGAMDILAVNIGKVAKELSDENPAAFGLFSDASDRLKGLLKNYVSADESNDYAAVKKAGYAIANYMATEADPSEFEGSGKNIRALYMMTDGFNVLRKIQAKLDGLEYDPNEMPSGVSTQSPPQSSAPDTPGVISTWWDAVQTGKIPGVFESAVGNKESEIGIGPNGQKIINFGKNIIADQLMKLEVSRSMIKKGLNSISNSIGDANSSLKQSALKGDKTAEKKLLDMGYTKTYTTKGGKKVAIDYVKKDK